jgi:hypothetical protein
MTTQYAVFKGLPTGLTLTKKVFTDAVPDTEVTGITGAVTERTNAKGEYVVAVTKSAVITGIHTLILFVGSTPIATGSRTFAGTDGETATTTPETVELDSSVGTQINNIENAAGYLLAVAAGACADPQTAAETYAITVFGSTFTVDMAGQDSTGTRTAPTLTKS